ncbi:CBS domain-containing protein [Elusimicrobiota bacterium]
MILEALTVGSLAGSCAASAMETAILSMGFAEEKRMFSSLGTGKFTGALARVYLSFLDEWKKHPAAFLTLILIANTVFSLFWCTFGLFFLPEARYSPLILGIFLFLIGDLLPKIMARRFPENVLYVMLLPFGLSFKATRRVFIPIGAVLERVTRIKMPSIPHYFKESELKALFRDKELSHRIRPRARVVLEGMLGFSSRKARDAMRPVKEIFYMNINDDNEEQLIKRAMSVPYSRIPVTTSSSIDDIKGILYVKDLLFTIATKDLVRIEDIVRPPLICSETDKLGRLMDEFRNTGIHIAIVKDKNRKVTGMISLEDILEEFMGEIHDEFTK